MTKRGTKCETFDASYNDLQQIIDKVDDIIKRYPHLKYKDFGFGVGYEYGDPIVEVEYYRLETDEEQESRIRNENFRKRQIEAEKRMQYEALKKEFEK
jgi:hypothetical protein